MVTQLRKAEENAAQLFQEITSRSMIRPGITERMLSKAVYDLAKEMFGVTAHWHKRIVRTGRNTLEPYRENPPDLTISNNDILFLDFGPVFEQWEADFGRTYVLGHDPLKHKLKEDVEKAWHAGKEYFDSNPDITGAQLFLFLKDLAPQMGWEFGGSIGGHLVGRFPHSKIYGRNVYNYIHPANRARMRKPFRNEIEKFWILEIHFVDREREIGGFFEQLLH